MAKIPGHRKGGPIKKEPKAPPIPIREQVGLGPLKPAFLPEIKEFHLTDLGNAQMMVSEHGDNFRYNHVQKKWLVWNNKNWQIDDTAKIFRYAKNTVRNFYHEASICEDNSEREKLVNHALKCESSNKINAMIELAKSEEGVPILPDELDINKMLFNVRNGTLNLTTLQLKPHVREDFITKISPVTYDPDAKCPKWKEFLNYFFNGDKELIRFVQKSIGYTLTGSNAEKSIFILYGRGNNGKSTFTNVISALFGDYSGEIPIQVLLRQKFESVPQDLARLNKVRFARSAESNKNRALDEGKIKHITGGTKVTVRHLYSHPFDMIPEFNIWLETNHLPVIQGTDDAIWNRIKAIPFAVQIPSDKIISNYWEVIIEEELSGVLNWALEGCKLWQEERLGMPDAVFNAVKKYRTDEDIIGQFLSDCCEINKTSEILNKDLYNEYKEWTILQGEKALSNPKFIKSIEERGFVKSREGGTGLTSFIGLALGKNQNVKQNEEVVREISTASAPQTVKACEAKQVNPELSKLPSSCKKVSNSPNLLHNASQKNNDLRNQNTKNANNSEKIKYIIEMVKEGGKFRETLRCRLPVKIFTESSFQRNLQGSGENPTGSP
jgi:putative DNA primase/helicase